jgi:hypothetical protein
MAFTWDDTIDLLKIITAKDRRTSGESDIRFWLAAATEAGWPSLAFAVAAVIKFANDNPGVWIEPGHITAYHRKIKSEVFQAWNPPAPPRELIDDPEGAQRWANERFEASLAAAVDQFTGIGQGTARRLEQRR